MYNDRSAYYGHPAQDNPPSNCRRGIDREFEGVISSAIEEAVSQYHNLLRHGLDIEMQRIVQEFEEATSQIDVTIARRVRARLVEIVQEEVRRVFDETLGNAEQTLVDPIWAKARDKHLSYISDYSKHNAQWESEPPRERGYNAHPTTAVGQQG